MLRSSHINQDCLTEVSETPFFIKDQESGCCELSTKDNWDLKVENKTEGPIHFLKIDKCVFGDEHSKRCDCAVFNDKKAFFVEIKEMVDFETNKKQSKKRNRARKQLISSINDFKEFGLKDLTKVTAVMALSPVLGIKTPILISTRGQSELDDFLTQCGCPNLVQGNYIEFN